MVFITTIFLSGLIRLTLLYVVTRLSYATGADLSIKIYRNTLYQDYIVHTSRNSSEIINGIINKTNTVIGGIVTPILNIITSTIIIIAIIGMMLAINPGIAMSALFGFGIIYLVVILYTKKKLQVNSEIIAIQSTQMIKSLQEGLGGIRDVLIDESQEFYCKIYRKADLSLRRASGDNVFIAQGPRYAVETVGVSLIVILAYGMSSQESNIDMVVPILGSMALAAQRLLPLLQQAYSGYSALKGSYSSFQDVLEMLEQPLPQYAQQSFQVEKFKNPIIFQKNIALKNIGFYYASDDRVNNSNVLDKINFKITKGSCVGFMGETGSGKSTLLDIIMGLLSPTEGHLEIDGVSITDKNRRAWRAHIAHVPQNIYLTDGTMEENIAFGVPRERIDHQQVKKASKQAQIDVLIEGWSEGYNTLVGENGVKLSGGQRQRIGIARALYKNSNVLILDEATSALDTKTEQEVTKAIEALNKDITVLIIAHRISTLKKCDQIIQIKNNGDIDYLSYQDMARLKSNFKS
jgi:ATP-binding cassette subfamily B protein